MKKNNFKPLPPFKGWVLQNFPFIEEDFDAITSYQLWCKIVEYVKVIGANNEELIKDFIELNNKFNELVQYVDDYFDELNIQTEINNKLDEMALDGTLERIINEELFTDLNNTINETKNKVDTLEPIVYDNEKNIKFPSYSLGLKRIFRFLEDSEYLSLQGTCITPYNTIICALWDGTTNANKIVEINYSTGLVIKSQDYQFGWCNGITLDSVNNKIYVVPRGDNNDYLRTIKVLDYADFSLLDSITFDDYVQSIYFDKETHKLYVMNEWGLRSDNEFKIYEVDSNFEVLNTIEINYNEIDNLRIQNFAIEDNYIYLLSSDPKSLVIYNIDGSLFKKYNLPEMISKLYYSGEYQDIDFLNNKCYISSADNVVGIESINQLFELNFSENINESEETGVVHYGYSINLYVDSNSTSINPDGSESNKFKSINESLRYDNPCTIIVADGTYNGVDIRNKSNTNIIGSSNTIVKGINMTYNSNCSLDTITINEDMFNNSGYINIYQSNVMLKSVTITGDKYGIYVGAKSSCKLSSGVNITTTADNQIYVRSESILYLPSTDYKVQKHNRSTTIVGGIKMFENDQSMVVGEFNFENSCNYILNGNGFTGFYKYADVVFNYANHDYIRRFPITDNGLKFWIDERHFIGNGSGGGGTVYIDINNNKLRLRFSRVLSVSNTGTATVVTNSDNESYAESSVIVKNIILY